MPDIRFYMLGERAVVVESTAAVSLSLQQKIWGLAQRLKQLPQVAELIPGMNNLTIILTDIPSSSEQALEQLQCWWHAAESYVPASRLIDIPVTYGGQAGPDLAALAEFVELSEPQVVELHAATRYTVYFIGFQPGFPYLAGLNRALWCPRHAQPRQRVAAGSVGIAGEQTGIYPLASLGGWQIIGHTTRKLFDLQNDDAVLLRPGDQLRFVPQKEGVC